jgi:hypothetical protein
VFYSLQHSSVAVLDPFPVGSNIQILDALLDNVPIISAPYLQECTNSHSIGIAKSIGLQSQNIEWPTSIEEYAVMALRLQSDMSFRQKFVRSTVKEKLKPGNHGIQILNFIKRLKIN